MIELCPSGEAFAVMAEDFNFDRCRHVIGFPGYFPITDTADFLFESIQVFLPVLIMLSTILFDTVFQFVETLLRVRHERELLPADEITERKHKPFAVKRQGRHNGIR